MTTRHSAAAPILAALGIVLAMLGAYVGAYLGLCEMTYEWTDSEEGFYVERLYEYDWARTVFAPAAWMEGKIRGHNVDIL